MVFYELQLTRVNTFRAYVLGETGRFSAMIKNNEIRYYAASIYWDLFHAQACRPEGLKRSVYSGRYQ